MNKQVDKRSTGPRAKVEIRVDLGTYGKYFLSRLENVSIGGAFVRTDEIHPISTEISLRFQLPNDEKQIEAVGEVVWTYNQAGRSEQNSTGMGVRFIEISAEDKERIAKFVEESKTS